MGSVGASAGAYGTLLHDRTNCRRMRNDFPRRRWRSRRTHAPAGNRSDSRDISGTIPPAGRRWSARPALRLPVDDMRFHGSAPHSILAVAAASLLVIALVSDHADADGLPPVRPKRGGIT